MKAYDSIDHDYLAQVIENLHLPGWLSLFIKQTVKKWNIEIRWHNNTLMHKKVERGILQGDSLSPLLFVLCLDPLSRHLTRLFPKVEIQVPGDRVYATNHFLYIDDLKIFAHEESTIIGMTREVELFFKNTGFVINRDKSATNTEACASIAKMMEGPDTYRYLGVTENRHSITECNAMYETIVNEICRRVELLAASKLSAKNLSLAINEYALSVINYYVGVIPMDITYFNRIDLESRGHVVTTVDDVKGAESGEILEESDGEEGLGKTGPWTSDPEFARSILDSNLKLQFDAYAEFLKDVCHSAIAEVRIPKPEWLGSSEHSCNNDICCIRCGTCRDTPATDYTRTIYTGSSNTDVKKGQRFERETALARTDMLESMLGQCVCMCNCLSDRRLVDRVIRDNSKVRREGNCGIVWHDMECPENMLDAEYPDLPQEGVLQERFILRVKAEYIPLSWKQRSPFACKLDIITDTANDDVYSGESPNHTDGGRATPREQQRNETAGNGVLHNTPLSTSPTSQSPSRHGSNVSGGNRPSILHGPSDTPNRNADPEGCANVQESPVLKLEESKDLSSFTLWDAVEALAEEQRELHRILRNNEFTDCFDAMEIDVSQLTREKLVLNSDCIIDDPNSEDYVEIALYLPYAPSCIMPWRFESIDTVEIMSQLPKFVPIVEVERRYGVLEDVDSIGPPDSEETTQSDDVMPDECFIARDIGTLEHLDELVNTPTNIRAYEDLSSNSGSGTLVESSTTPYADDASTLGSDTSSPTIIKDLFYDYTDGESETLAYSEVLRDMMVVPLCVKRVLQVMREHILVRNEVLNEEAHACKLYRRQWHQHLKRMKAAAPKVDDFAWVCFP
ncbi:myb-like DNA-binding domain containing protein [Babesia ovata]|uniref:Myb-like DNA-binding domain containing protein n=1 Tax=Babesia ovata TaxID=189622 RepID=A0A2H6KK22_9APIC|nr:myb-like DNA-binding domain containing protein [Babesia ovata]GBE63330.1 myb-like DNA-binding domain containing protein [Babesia ovata]